MADDQIDVLIRLRDELSRTLDQARRNLEGFDRTIHDTDRSLGNLERAMGHAGTAAERVANRMDGLRRTIGHLDQDLGNLRRAIDSSITKFGELDAAAGRVERKFRDLEYSSGHLDVKMRRLDAAVGELTRDMLAAAAAAQLLNSRLNAVNQGSNNAGNSARKASQAHKDWANVITHKGMPALEAMLPFIGKILGMNVTWLAGIQAASSGILALGAAGIAAVYELSPLGGLIAAYPVMVGAAAQAFVAGKMAMKGMGDAASALASGDMAKATEAMKDMGPNAKSAAQSLGFLKMAWDKISRGTQEAFWSRLGPSLHSLTGLLPILNNGFTNMGTALGDVGKYAVQMTQTPAFRRNLGDIMRGNTVIMASLGKAGVNAFVGLSGVMRAAIPLVIKISAAIGKAAAHFANWANSAHGQSVMSRFFDRTWDVLKRIGRILQDVGIGLKNVFQSSTPMLGRFGDGIEHIAESFRDWTSQTGNQNRMTQFFKDSVPIVRELGLLIRDVAAALMGIGTSSEGMQATYDTLVRIRTTVVPLLANIEKSNGPTVLEQLGRLLENISQILGALPFSAMSIFLGLLADLAGFVAALVKNVPGLGYLVAAFLAFSAVNRVMGIFRTTMGGAMASGIAGWFSGLVRTFARGSGTVQSFGNALSYIGQTLGKAGIWVAAIVALVNVVSVFGQISKHADDIRKVNKALDEGLPSIQKYEDGIKQLQTQYNDALSVFKDPQSIVTGLFTGKLAKGVTAAVQGSGTEDVQNRYTKYLDVINQLQGEFGMTQQQVIDLADSMGIDLEQGAAGAAAAIRATGKSTDELVASTDAAKKAFSDFGNVIDNIFDKAYGLTQATDQYQSSLNKLPQNLDQSSKALGGNTEAAITNRGAIMDSLSALKDKVKAQFQETYNNSTAVNEQQRIQEATTTANERLQEGRQALIEQAVAAGMDRGEVTKLVNKFGDIPGDIHTAIQVEIKGPTSQLLELRNKITSLPDGSFTIKSPTEAEIAKLTDMGFQLQRLPDGSFKLVAKTEQANNTILGFETVVSQTMPEMKIGANTIPAGEQVNILEGKVTGTPVTMKVLADPTTAQGDIQNILTYLATHPGVMTIDGHPASAIEQANYAANYVNQQHPGMHIEAVTNQATGQVTAWRITEGGKTTTVPVAANTAAMPGQVAGGVNSGAPYQANTSANTSGLAGQIAGAIGSLPGFAVNIIGHISDVVTSGGQSILGSIGSFLGIGGNAAGGLITGPGTGTSDSIASWLSNGEFVVNAASTRDWLPFLTAINDRNTGNVLPSRIMATLPQPSPSGSVTQHGGRVVFADDRPIPTEARPNVAYGGDTVHISVPIATAQHPIDVERAVHRALIKYQQQRKERR